jgi:hypothetical protein
MLPEVAAYLAKGGRIRYFEPGASADPGNIIEWMQRQGEPVKYAGRGTAKIGKRIVDLAGLFDYANAMRRARNLEPFSLHKSKTMRHFFFGSPTVPARDKAA